MDPNLFRLNWEQAGEVLATVVVLSFIVERALAVVFEHPSFAPAAGKGLKAPIAVLAAFLICTYWKLDALAVILHGEKVSLAGELITAAVIAGGSKASLKLFRDVLGVESEKAKKVRLASTSKVTPAQSP